MTVSIDRVAGSEPGGVRVASSPIGKSLRAARGRAGWSRETLAHHSGLSWAAIAQIESGRRQEVRLGSLVALANALGISVDYLVGSKATVSPKLLEHRVLLYGSDEEYLASTVPFLVEGVARADTLLAVAAGRQIGMLRDALGDNAAHVEFRDSTEWYCSPSAALNQYHTFVEGAFERGAPWIRIIGEPVWTGRTEDEVAEWKRYESIINLSFASSPATILCPYDSTSVPERILAGARHTHPEIASNGDLTASLTYQAPEDLLIALK
jgi:transcriptional regulator with XRE-family HTH domain